MRASPSVRRCARPECVSERGDADPFFVHVSQADPLRTIPANASVPGDCASCAARGARCEGYNGPARPVTPEGE